MARGLVQIVGRGVLRTEEINEDLSAFSTSKTPGNALPGVFHQESRTDGADAFFARPNRH